jgi:hypothetical protein
MNYGIHARELIQELARSNGKNNDTSTTSVATIPPYNDETVRLALQDMQLHIQALNDQYVAVKTIMKEQSTPLSIRPSILLQNAAVMRHKRALLTYHYVRMQRLIQGAYWQQQPLLGNERSLPSKKHSSAAGTVDNAEQPLSESTTSQTSHSSKKRVLCPAEVDFYHEYQRLVADYTAQVLPAFAVDALRAYTGPPPTPTDHVLVRVVQGTTSEDRQDGAIVLESGQTVHLGQVGSTHYLLWSDVEEYVRTGHLVVLSE